MPPASYPDFNSHFTWFLRAARVMPVVAIAALGGGVIGGFSVLALDLAISSPPNHAISGNLDKINPAKAADATTTASAPSSPPGGSPIAAPPPMRTFDISGPTPPPQSAASVSSPAPTPSAPAVSAAPAPAATPVVQQTPPPAPWPDALSRVHPATPEQADIQQSKVLAQPPTPQGLPAHHPDTIAAAPPPDQSSAPSTSEVAHKPAKKAVAMRSRSQPQSAGTSGETARAAPSGVYDYYGSDFDDQRAIQPDDNAATQAESTRTVRKPAAKVHVIVRRQEPDDTDQPYDARETRTGFPPQPAQPSLFGLFGGDRE